MPRRALAAFVIVTILCGSLYLLHSPDKGVGAPCGGDFHVKTCSGNLECVPNHPFSGGMGTSGTCRPPVDQSAASPPALPGMGSTLSSPIQSRPAFLFNENTRTGRPAKGIVWEPAPPAEVRSPGNGLVTHADDFRGYGNLVIIRADGGYHILIAGITTLAVKNGDTVTSGTLLGVATDNSSTPPPNDGVARAVKPTIYFELRKDGQPIDPSPWLPLPYSK